MSVAQKFTLSILVSMWLIISTAIPVWCEASTNEVKSATELAREEGKERRAKSHQAKGVLKDIDLLRHQLKLTTEDGVQTFTYTERTFFFRDKERTSMDKLSRGEVIALRFNTDTNGNATVTVIKTQTLPASTNQPPTSLP
jgi:Cu/Ag efflux protein CusF